uniref:Uncharacterized protein n=1 Tax=Hyaloperonospora arabidopsidis (strain Emoy2) TaxID=559515 RepID=M4B2E3_HYAAE
MRLPSTFYVGRLKRYCPSVLPTSMDSSRAHKAVLDTVEPLEDQDSATPATPRCRAVARRSTVPSALVAAQIPQQC